MTREDYRQPDLAPGLEVAIHIGPGPSTHRHPKLPPRGWNWPAGPGLLPGLLEPLAGTTGSSPYRQVGQPCQRRATRSRNSRDLPLCHARYLPGLRSEEMRAQCLGMRTFIDLRPSRRALRRCSPISCGWRWRRTWPVSRAPPDITQSPTCAATWPGAQNAAWTRSPRAARTLSCTSGGCRKSAGSSPRQCRGGSQSPLASTGPA
jgi:hypothetical protein